MMTAEPRARFEDYETLLLELEAAEAEAQAEAEAANAPEQASAPEEAGDAEQASAPEEAGDAEAEEAGDAPTRALGASWQELFDLADDEGLLARAHALRTGKGVERDLADCFECYQAAGELGNADAKFAVALFYLSGAVVAEDLNAGLGKLRDAASAGSLRARIYLANVYDLGVGREGDSDKANVWYRASARAADIEHEPETDAFDRAMAELGCIRFVRTLLTDESIAKKDRYGFLAKAKALGYELYQRHKTRAAAEDEAIAREIEEAMQAEAEQAAVDTERSSEAESADGDAGDAAAAADDAKTSGTKTTGTNSKKDQEEPAPKSLVGGVPQTVSERLTAFAIAAVFVAAGVGVGFALSAGARELLAAGQAVPVIGQRVWPILPAMVAASLVPAMLVYQLTTLLLSSVAGVALGIAGWSIWVSAPGQLFADRLLQAQVFGVTGLVVALLVIGMMGGTRRKRWQTS